jgi:hypothetical protein
MQDIEQAIRERAYHLWLESGSPHGDADAHWLAAQREILSASLSELGHVAPSGTKPKKVRVIRKKRAA